MSKRLIVVLIMAALAILALIFGWRFESEAGAISDNHLYSMEELEKLPIDTKVWVEYQEGKTSYSDEAMVRADKEGIGPILRNSTGYWSLNESWHFGDKYRVWVKPPSEQERTAISWADSPW